MSVYLVAAVDKADADKYSDYEKKSAPSFAKYGIEILVVEEAPTLLEGALPGGRIVVLRAENQAAMDRWYQSPEYQAALPIRQASGTTHFLITCKGFADA